MSVVVDHVRDMSILDSGVVHGRYGRATTGGVRYRISLAAIATIGPVIPPLHP